MKFIFKAKDSAGSVKRGKIEAIDRNAAAQSLQKSGLIPILILQEKKVPQFVKNLQKQWEGISQKELMIFFRQLAILIEAKVPIFSALFAVEEQTENRFLRTIIREVRQDIEDGMSLSDALSKQSNVFSPLIINMIKAGELSGNLQRAIVFIADNIEKNHKLSSKVKGALIYPAFVITAAFVAGFLTVSFILPKLMGVIEELDVEIPWYTKLLILIGGFMGSYWWAVILVLLSGVVGFFYYIKTEVGRREWDQIKIRLPIVGKILRYVCLGRFADNLGMLVSGGIPIVYALTMVSDIVDNTVYQKIILRAADEVKTGGNISSVFERSSEIPSVVTSMLKVGEETGKMTEILKKVSSFYENEVDRMTKNLSTLIEPVLIVILGIGVAILVMAILMPIYNIAGSL